MLYNVQSQQRAVFMFIRGCCMETCTLSNVLKGVFGFHNVQCSKRTQSLLQNCLCKQSCGLLGGVWKTCTKLCIIICVFSLCSMYTTGKAQTSRQGALKL